MTCDSACHHSVYTVCTQWLRPYLTFLKDAKCLLFFCGTWLCTIFSYKHFLSYEHPLVPCCPDKRGFTVVHLFNLHSATRTDLAHAFCAPLVDCSLESLCSAAIYLFSHAIVMHIRPLNHMLYSVLYSFSFILADKYYVSTCVPIWSAYHSRNPGVSKLTMDRV